MSQDLQFDGKKYISSKRATQSCGYTQDYIGQLIRGKKIDARMVGRAWFVSEESILSYKKQIDLSGTNQVSVPPTLQYLTDPRPLLPELKKLAPKPVVSEAVSRVALTSQKTLGDIVRTVISTHDIGKKISAAILSLSIIFTTTTVGGLYTSTNIQQSAHASLATIAEGVYDSFVSLFKNDIRPAFSRIASVVGSGFGSTLDTAKNSSVVSIVNEKPSAQIVKNYITNATAGVSAKDVALAMALIKEDLQDQIGSLQNASAINLRNIRSSSERDRTSVINNSTISNSTLKNPSITGASISGSSISNSSVAATSLTAAWADITNAVLSESVVSNGTTTNATSTNLYSDLVTVSGTISLQSATPIVTANKLYAQGTDLYWAGNVVSGASTASWASDGTHAWRATGNVGIGTTTPAKALEINSATGNNLRLTYNNTDKNADFSMQNDGGLNINLNYGPLKITNDRNSLQSVMLASDIYVPVNGLATVSAGKIALNSVPFGVNEGSLGFNTYMTAGQSYALISGSKGFVLRQGEGGGSTDGSLYFESLVSGIRNTRFVLDPGGNVGVGSTTPWAQLSVNPNGVTGPSFVVGSSTKTDFIVTNEGFVGIGSTNPKHVFQIGSGTTGSYDDGRSILTGGGEQQDTTPKAIITATISNTSGSIKSIGLDLHNDDIGTDGLRSPALTFSDRSNTTYTSVLAGIDAVDLGQGRDANWRAGGLAFHTMSTGMGGNLERVRIDANGNMGINTITPTEKLQVNGNVRTLGNVRVESTIGSNVDTKFDLNATYYGGSNNYSSAGLEVKGTKDFGTVDSIQGALRFFAGADTAATTGWALRSDALLSTTTLSGSGAQFVLNKSGNVGVGTTSPSQALSIQGNGLFSGNISAANLTATGTLTVAGIINSSTDTATRYTATSNTASIFPYASTTAITSSGSAYFATAGGNVGIGNTNPAQKLSLTVSNTNSYDGIAVGDGTTNSYFLDVNNSSLWDSSSWTGLGIGTGSNHPISFATNSTKRMTITAGGNVGIGTTTPTNKLSVISPDGGPLFYSGNTSNYLSMSLGRTANDAVVCIAEGVNRCVIGAAAGDMVIRSENHKIILNADGGSSMNLVASGSYLGIGTNNPVSTLHINSGSNVTSAIRITSNNNANAADIGVAGSNGAIFTNALTGDLAVRFNSGNNLIFGDSGPTELMRITSSGSVGIGTSTPQSKFHVNSSSADSRISVSAGSGAVMTQLIANTSTNTGYVGTANNFPFVIRVNDTNAGTFDTSGTFTLNGLGSNPRLNFGGGSLGVINRGGTGGTAYNLYIGETADTGKLIMRGSGFTTIESSVGIGTLTPLSKLDVQAATNKHLQVTTASGSLSGISLYAGTDADAYNALQIDGSSLLLNTRSGGNVGIGTTTPNYKLTVNGGIAITRHSSTDSVDHSVAFTTTDDVSTLTPQFSIGDYNGTYGSTTTIDFNLGFDHAGMRLWSPNASLYLGNDISSNGAGPNVGVTPGFYGQSFSVWENSTGSNYPTIKAGVLQMVGDEVGMKAQGNWLGMADLSNNYVWSFNNDVADGTIDGIPSDNKLRVHKDLIALTKLGVATSSPASTFTVGSGGACFSGGTGSTVACGNTGGNLYYRTANTGTYDVAENYMTSDDTIVAGDIVALDTLTASTITKATTGSHILGIVSTDPGLLLGGADGNNNGSTTRPVALSGRVPVKVNGENGNIAIGDKISLSSVAGVGRKSKGSEEAVGVALESWTGGVGDTGTVMVFVSTKQYFDQEKFSIDQNGNVGIGTTTPTYKLQIMGDIAATSFVNISTRDAKHDITYLDGTQKASILDRIKTIGIAQYRYNTESESNPLRLGLIAEEAPTEILAVGGKGVDVYKLSTFILAGVQEMQSTIEKMNLSVEDLKARMTTVEGRLASLEQFIEMGGLSQMNAADTASTTRGTVHSFLASAGIAIDALSSKITSIATDAVSANFVVVNQTLKVQSVQAESISSSELRVGTSTNPSQSGITIIDRGTGQPYCMFILNGVMQNQAGDCATQIAPNSNEQSSHNTSGSVYGGGNTSGTSGTTTESVNDTGTSTPDGGVSSEGSTTGGENTGEVISESGTGSDGGTPSGGESVPVVETPPEAPVENPVP